MKSLFNKYKSQLSISLFITSIVFFYYSYLFFKLNIPLEFRNLYLVLAYPSDPIYLKVIESLNNLDNIPQGKNIIQYIFEIIIYKSIGFKYIWLTIPLFKSISISIISLCLKKVYNLKFTELLILVLFLFCLFFTNSATFADRFSRPHIIPILLPISYLFFMKFVSNIKKIYLILSIVTLSFLFPADPWIVCCFLVFYTLFFFFKKQYINILLIIISFLFSVILIFISTTNYDLGFNSSLQLEYLGFKEIYSSENFIIDYFKSIITDLRLLISLLFLSIISILNRSKFLIFCVYCTLLLGWLPYIIIDSSLQAYHIIIATKSFLSYVLIFQIAKFISKYEINFSIKKFKYLFLIIIVLLIKFNSFENPVFNRADNIFKNYSATFNEINSVDDSCEIISNDIYARGYTLAFTKKRLSVADGFYDPVIIEEVVCKIERTMLFLKNNYKFKNEMEYLNSSNKFLHYATHNYFSISNSLIAPSLKKHLNNFNNNKFKSTFEPWNMVYPDSNFGNNKCKINTISSGLIILKNDYNYFSEPPMIINICDNN
tara:strand:+ start:699 stop:2333 length:1635 start_codon:yes stop_codon:yes gene_type:complete